MEQILITYYADNARKLHRTVDRILLRFGGLSNKDVDDFYSLANETFVYAMKRYDGEQSFDGFLYSCLSNKIKSEITRRNREKRKADRMAVSIDMPVGEDGDCTLADILADGFDTEQEVFAELDSMAYKLECYLALLSKRQKKVLHLLAECYKAAEIQEMLQMNQREYADELKTIRAYEKIRILL
jgi:RNA polymerase sigma factor (sigma-70 family)